MTTRNWPVIAVAMNQTHAHLIGGVLTARGVECRLDTGEGGDGLCVYYGAWPRSVRVAPGDVGRARRELERARAEGASIDWSGVALGEFEPGAPRGLSWGSVRWLRRHAVVIGAVLALGVMLAEPIRVMIWVLGR